MRRYVCPPWYECICPRGRTVSFTTMWNHRREANQIRKAHGRGAFRNGPRVPESANEYYFATNESLFDHETDQEDNERTWFVRGRITNERRAFMDKQSIGNNEQDPANFQNQINDLSMKENAPELCQQVSILPELIVDQRIGNTETLHPSRTSRSYLHALNSSNIHYAETAAVHDEEIHNHQFTSNGTPVADTHNSNLSSTKTHGPQLFSNARNDEAESIQVLSPLYQVQAQQHSLLLQLDSTANDDEQLQTQSSILENAAVSPEESQSEVSILFEEPQLDHFCRIPGMWEWINDNQGLVDIFFKHGLEYTVMDDMLQHLQAPCKTWVAVLDAIYRYSGLKERLVVTPTCPGHMAFIDWNISHKYENDCLQCHSSRPSSLKEAKGSTTYIPLIPRIRAMVANEQSCEKLYDYGHEQYLPSDTMADVFDGTAYKDICNHYDGEDQVKYDVFIGASMDGFQVFKKTDHEVWSLAALNLNLPPHERYLPRNILPLSFLPGPNQPKNMQSYLVPFIQELQQSSENGGIKMKLYNNIERKVRIHLLYFSGDQQAVSKAAGLAGHNGRYPCRNCSIRGQHIGHYYYPSKMIVSDHDEFRIEKYFNPRALPIRIETDSSSVALEIEGLTE